MGYRVSLKSVPDAANKYREICECVECVGVDVRGMWRGGGGRRRVCTRSMCVCMGALWSVSAGLWVWMKM
jgi:hypothetical protein